MYFYTCIFVQNNPESFSILFNGKWSRQGVFFLFPFFSSSPAHLGPFSLRPGPWRSGTRLLLHLSTVELLSPPLLSQRRRRHGGRRTRTWRGGPLPYLSSPRAPSWNPRSVPPPLFFSQ